MAGVVADEPASDINHHGASPHSTAPIPAAASTPGNEHTQPLHQQQQPQQEQQHQHKAYEPPLSRETAQAAAAWGGAGVAAGQQTSQEDLFSHVVLEDGDDCGPISVQNVRASSFKRWGGGGGGLAAGPG